jgi:hypothetical protein
MEKTDGARPVIGTASAIVPGPADRPVSSRPGRTLTDSAE